MGKAKFCRQGTSLVVMVCRVDFAIILWISSCIRLRIVCGENSETNHMHALCPVYAKK